MEASETTIPSAGHLLETLLRTTHRLHLRFEAQLSAFEVPEYLSGPRLRFLVSVAEAGQIRMSDIAAKLGIKPRTVTQFVDALEQEKLIVRQPDPEDRRATFIQLSDTAPPLIQQARLAMSESADMVLASITPEERGELLRLLHQLSE
ncbi:MULTISPECIES: MarR family transcriptional regulator [unclassified Paenibacillus]|uniref:MarR family winged helix-turn-helix transcriptional regulator n=1 Tax=unclassified Paenibacillus TaxID=185978 RepID=UPI0010531E5F|nr:MULTISPECIES: MarR family transcriptional regulator [unclassified Paenibacillus]NIK67188.1 DNA-binding MarR family transcriptional regulator [Paenibacillus sp. BK720]TCN01237.1 MarR family transcriptional regulator [Paenibacillus sp. BK033]